MFYVGGKTRIAKQIASIVHPTGPWWDPFCGGLSCAKALVKYHPEGLISDISVPLFYLYDAVRKGWIPPEKVSAKEHEEAKELSDICPLKGFIGFACSYGGMYFSGYAGDRVVISKSHPNGMKQNPAKHASRSLVEDLRETLATCRIARLDFLAQPVVPNKFECIYCDPPYEGTVPYRGTPTFNYQAFWNKASAWANTGTRVYVSELACPVPHEEVWQKSYEKRLGSGGGQINNSKIEKLFRIR